MLSGFVLAHHGRWLPAAEPLHVISRQPRRRRGVNQGWTTTGQAFQGTLFQSPNIVSTAGNIQVLSNNLNWVNFSTMPHAPVRAWTLARAADGSARYFAADSSVPHLNTCSILIEAAAAGQCWVCLVNNFPVNVF